MNINPIEENEKEEPTSNNYKVLEDNEKKVLYKIFVNVKNFKSEQEIMLGEEATVEEAIIKTINLDQP